MGVIFKIQSLNRTYVRRGIIHALPQPPSSSLKSTVSYHNDSIS
nr:MAG TPA: hypothetical protein [Caudoviricetes sp.]